MALSPVWFRPFLPSYADRAGSPTGALRIGGEVHRRALAAMSAPLLPADARQPETVTGPAANTASDRPPSRKQSLRVRRLQSDLRELIRHVACRPSLPAANGQAVPPGSAAPRPDLGPYAALLVVAPEAIAGNGQLLGQLYDSLEGPDRVASPRHYKASGSHEPSWGAARTTTCLGHKVRGPVAVPLGTWECGVRRLVFLATSCCWSMGTEDDGRSSNSSLIRAEYQTAENTLGIARAASSAVGSAADYNCPQPSATARGSGAERSQAAGRGSQWYLLCAQMADALSRMHGVRQELRIWNVISGRLSYVSPITWLPRGS